MRGEVWAPMGELPDGVVGYLVVQSERLARIAPTVTVAVVTATEQRAGPPLAVPVPAGETPLGGAVWIKTTQLHTLARSRLLRPLAALTPARLREVDAALRMVLGLDS